MTNLTHADIQEDGYYWVEIAKTIYTRGRLYDGDVMIAFNPDTNTILYKHSRVGLPNTMISNSPDWVIQDWEGYL